MCDRPEVPKTVKPRRVTAATGVTGFRGPWLVVHSDDYLLVEETGELLPADHLPAVTARRAPFIFVSQDSGRALAELDSYFDSDPAWQFRLTPIDREIWKPNRDERPTIVRQTVINYFGFRKGYGRDSNLYHQVLDPTMFLHRFALRDMVTHDSGTPDMVRLRDWARAVRDWAIYHGLTLRPTAGSLTAQLLRDPRFYPVARRKVPRATNSRAREVLPGNYYSLRAVDPDERRKYNAAYLDQHSAHHSIAASIPLPNPDRLYAKGFFRHLERGQVWARHGSRLYERTVREHGLLYLRVRNPLKWKRDAYPLPCQETPGFCNVFVWSNEIEHIEHSPTEIFGVIAAWTADTPDEGIRAYAQFAQRELADVPDAPWLKPTLLSAYGILAAAPRKFETAYKRTEGDKGDRAMYPVGGSLLEVRRYRASREHESGIANVIQRGMIEAETRLRSIRMAMYLQSCGLTILAIYADSVFVELTDIPLPLIPAGWTLKGELQDLQFFNSTSFTSDKLTKLPGIPKDDDDRLQRARSWHSLLVETRAIDSGRQRPRRKRGGSVRPNR